MSAESTDQPDTTTGEQQPVEQWVERTAAFWGRALAGAVRIVFARNEEKPETTR